MERLTYMDGGKWRMRIGDTEYSGKEADRVSDYENTGLEPEKIEQLKGEVFGLRLDKQELEQYRSLGPIDRLRELVEADREGRCVVLPCKIGDTLYRIQRFKRGKNWRKEAEYIRTAELNKNNFWRVVFEGELGETVFLTREAADAALKGDQHG